MNTLGNVLGFFLVLVASAFVGLWPEAAAIGIWHLVHPVTEIGKIALALGLVAFGGGFGIMFGIIGFGMFVAGVSALITGRRW